MGDDSGVCTYINFCMNFDLLWSISQASWLLAAYQAHPNFMYLDAAFLTIFTFQTGTLLMSWRKAESPVFNMSVCLYYVSCALNSRSHLITNSVLLDPLLRASMIGGSNCGRSKVRHLACKSAPFFLINSDRSALWSSHGSYGWEKNSLDFFHKQFEKNLRKNGWSYIRLAFSTFVW